MSGSGGGRGVGLETERAVRAKAPGRIAATSVFWGFLLLVLVSPLPIGGEFPAGWSVLAVVSGLLLLAWTGLAASGAEPVRVPLRAILWIAVPYSLALIWIGVQAADWTPAAWHHPIWSEAQRALGREVTGRISIDSYATGSGALRLLALGAVFWLALEYGRDRTKAHLMLVAFVAAQTAYAAYGLAMEFAGEPYILWIVKEKYQDVVTATLRNRNNYATLVGLGLVAATGLLWMRLRRREGDRSFRLRLRHLIDDLGRHAWLLAAWLIMITALFLTESRAGVASTLLALLVLAGLFAAVARSRGRALLLVGLVVVVALFPLTLSSQGITKRLARVTDDSQSRISLYREARDAIETAPLLGFGSGTYPEVYYLYYHPERRLGNPARYAHNTYLENMLELGIPAAGLLFLAAAAAVFACLRGAFRRRRDRAFPAVAVAAGVLTSAHAIVDFSLQIFAVGIAWCFLVGLGVAQSRSSREGTG